MLDMIVRIKIIGGIVEVNIELYRGGTWSVDVEVFDSRNPQRSWAQVIDTPTQRVLNSGQCFNGGKTFPLQVLFKSNSSVSFRAEALVLPRSSLRLDTAVKAPRKLLDTAPFLYHQEHAAERIVEPSGILQLCRRNYIPILS